MSKERYSAALEPRSIPSFAITLAALALAAPAARAGDGLRVEARALASSPYVGQGVEVRVAVVGDAEAPRVIAPRVDGAELVVVGRDLRPIASSGIGAVVTETNLHTTRFRLTPNRPGPLTVPPFRASSGDRSGASAPIRLHARPVPLDGRPSSYLGGVGRIDARAEVAPASIRARGTFEYRLILKGPGALGSKAVPLVPELAAVPGLKVEPLGTALAADGASRTVRFRLRAAEPGELRLPSTAVATFDPDLGRYNETRAPGVNVRVVAVPRLDVPGPADVEAEQGTPGVVGRALAGLVGAAGAVAIGFILSRRRGSPGRLASRIARDLKRADGGEPGERIASALREYLRRANGRSGGELTPDEARLGVERATGDPGLADEARRLIEAADRARFGGPGEAAGLIPEAVAFFGRLAGRRRRRARDSDVATAA